MRRIKALLFSVHEVINPWKFHVAVWQTAVTSMKCTKVHSARAARLFFLIQQNHIIDLWCFRCRFEGVITSTPQLKALTLARATFTLVL